MLIPNKFNGYGRDGIRRYYKGGDGGAGDARKQEEDRQARVAAAVERINSIFDGGAVSSGKGRVTSVDPTQTYYTADGKQWRAPESQNGALLQALQSQQQQGYTPFQESTFNVSTGQWSTPQASSAPAIDPSMMYDQTAISDAINNGLYSSVETTSPNANRQALYDRQKSAVFDMNKRDIDKQFKDAERQNRFGLARAGLMGGSADVDSNAELQDRTNEGLIKATGLADSAAADLKTQDERSRQSLISMAQSGIDTGTAQSMAARQLDANAQAATGARQGATVGNLFGDMAQAYLMRQQGMGMNAGRNQNQQWYGVSTPQQTYGGTTG